MRDRRLALNWSQEQVASAMRLDGFKSWASGTVAATEAGKRAVSLGEVVALCDHLRVNLVEMLVHPANRPLSLLAPFGPSSHEPGVMAGASEIRARLHMPVQHWSGLLLAGDPAERLQRELDTLTDAHPLVVKLGLKASELMQAEADVKQWELLEVLGEELGVPPPCLAVIARRGWGQSALDQREHLAREAVEQGIATTMRGARNRASREIKMVLANKVEGLLT